MEQTGEASFAVDERPKGTGSSTMGIRQVSRKVVLIVRQALTAPWVHQFGTMVGVIRRCRERRMSGEIYSDIRNLSMGAGKVLSGMVEECRRKEGEQLCGALYQPWVISFIGRWAVPAPLNKMNLEVIQHKWANKRLI